MTLTIGSLFSGIGGLELGLERAGLGPVVWQVEREPYCRAVLAKHWPNATRYDDVCTVGAHTLAPVDVICGGFPCQDVSHAGRRAGLVEGTRSGLWFEFSRIIRELRPRYVVVENVAALLSLGIDAVLGTLADCGYDAEWSCVRAFDVGAPHLRDRVFILAYSDADDPGLEGRLVGVVRERADERTARAVGASVADADDIRRDARRFRGCGEAHERREALGAARGHGEALADPNDERSQGRWIPEGAERGAIPNADRRGAPVSGRATRSGRWWESEPDVGRVADGVPARVDRLRALGNAVVPQVAEVVGRLIVAREAALAMEAA